MRFKTKEKLAKKLLTAISEPCPENMEIMKFLIYAICSIIGLENLEVIVNTWIHLKEKENPTDKVIN
jgi:hypothetical protein